MNSLPTGNTPPWLLLIAIAAMGVVCAVAVVWITTIQYRVQKLATQVSSREASVASLASELEAQALLARQMSMDLEELRKRLIDHQEIAEPAVSRWETAGLPVNLNRRGQILRLSRKGKSVAEIAEDLNVAQGEVELILKVHDFSQTNPVQKNEKISSTI